MTLRNIYSTRGDLGVCDSSSDFKEKKKLLLKGKNVICH